MTILLQQSSSISAQDLSESSVQEVSFPTEERIATPDRNGGHIRNSLAYQNLYEESISQGDKFWRSMALKRLRWIQPFTDVKSESFESGNVMWFLNGKINVCDNCVDRWAESDPNRVALIWEGDEPGTSKSYTYRELQENVCRMANLFKSYGVRKYDSVALFFGVVPEAVFAMLACARLGAIHVVVFGGFSAPSLKERIIDARCKLIVTSDQAMRGGRIVPLKDTVDSIVDECPTVTNVIVFKQAMHPIKWNDARDVDGNQELLGQRPYCPVEPMDAEDVLFLLHTSGSTGRPKGIAHTTAGYLLYAGLTHETTFDVRPQDVFACMADIGWITGHTYCVYGPLSNGCTTVLFSSLPNYPTPSRYWDFVDHHRVTQIYTSPTAIRSLMRFGEEPVAGASLKSLRVIGSVGEPLNPEAFRWLWTIVGRERCHVVDTYWQTETGGHVLTTVPGAHFMKPGATGLPFLGLQFAIVDSTTGKEKIGNDVSGYLAIKGSWPGMLRTINGDHSRLVHSYFKPFPGFFFTGDGAYRDSDGYYWVTGRVDDTLNVSGHRLGTAEIEHALVAHKSVSEAAVVSIPHELKGNGICCYVTLKSGFSASTPNIREEISKMPRAQVSPIATPDALYIVDELPKTRSGKIVRRLLRKIACNEIDELGDMSTLSDPSIIPALILQVSQQRK